MSFDLRMLENEKVKKINVKKSDDSVEAFSADKIITSCMNAGASFLLASKIASEVAEHAYDEITTKDIRSMVHGHLAKVSPKVADQYMYKSYIRIRTSKTTLEPFTIEKIVDSLVKETGLDKNTAEVIARDVEKEMSRMRLNYVTAPLIREIVNVKLLEHGLESTRARYTRLGMPVYDVKNLIEQGSKENANLQHNPETIHKLMADQIAKEYALINVLPIDLADAHMAGQIHIHDLDYFAIRPFCFSHDIRFFLKNGFKADGTGDHTSIAGPAKKAEVAFLHAAKVLAASQTNCAGGQGFSYFNTFLAPYVRGRSYDEVKQLAQMFLYEMSQMYVARGGQMVFSSIDVDMAVPEQFKDIPAVQPGGKVDSSITYGDYESEVKMLFNTLIDVYLKGDYQGKPFNFPKFEVHIKPEELNNGKNENELMRVSALSAKFGTPYYIIQQPYMPEFSCYQCCAFLMPLEEATTSEDLVNGTIRGGALQVVTINLPQLAYEANGNEDKLFELLEERMNKAKEVHLLKNKVIHRNLESGMLPFMNQPIDNKGTRYLEPDKQSCVIGLVGTNELVKAFTGLELHEDVGWRFGLKVMKRMKDVVARFRKETGLNFTLARTPAESCSYRLAQIDLKNYSSRAVINGSGDSAYYTNGFHVRPSADVPLWRRLQVEGSFHPLTDGGAMSHVWLGEPNPSAEGIFDLTRKIATKTAIQYFAYTKDISVCNKCSTTAGGLQGKCINCGSTNLQWWSRITGYYQNVAGWNKGKLMELRERSRYGVAGSNKKIALDSRVKQRLDSYGVTNGGSHLDF